ncbi:MAG: ROK family glucokinase [Clostridia bacterium]|nr:ROK family glucokinase [Clostridia bacterium]
MISIGIDLGGTNIAVGAVDASGRIIASGSIKTRAERPYQSVVRDMAHAGLSVLKKAGIPLEEVRSIGVGIPGIAVKETGVVVFCTNLGWNNIPLRDELNRYIDKPVYIDNDATVAGYAESVAGVSAGTRSSVFLTLGTGVGGGIIIDGKPWSGPHGVASEIGHLTLVVDGEPCTCGKLGCLERYCSATAVGRIAIEVLKDHPESSLFALYKDSPSRINAKSVFDAARRGDTAALHAFDQYIKYLSLAINTIISFLDPEIIVLGGGVSRAGDFLLNAVREQLPKYLMFKSMPYSRIETAKLGSEAGIIGAAMLTS